MITVQYSPKGDLIASGSLDNNVKIWNSKTGENLKTFEGQSGYVNSVAFSPDG